MASIHISGLDEVMLMMDKLSDKGVVTEAAKEVVNQSVPELVDALKSAIASSSTGHGNNPGELADSITSIAAKENALGVFSVAKPEGLDSDRNLMTDRFRYLDRGRRDKKGEWHDGKGVRDKAVGMVQGSLEAKMTKLMEDKIGEIAD